MVGRVLWVLQEDFHILKIERKSSITKNHHKVRIILYLIYLKVTLLDKNIYINYN
jgi:hypothetical protein